MSTFIGISGTRGTRATRLAPGFAFAVLGLAASLLGGCSGHHTSVIGLLD